MSHTIPQKVAIAGLGREGRALVDFFAGRTEIHLFDELPKDSLPESVSSFTQSLIIPEDFEVVYKSPGIPPSKLTLEGATRIESLTNVFFDEAKGKIIGITGTKGKSTTSSLIHHILRENSFDAALVGNIGIPSLTALEGDSPDRVFVLEMSSFQCEFLTKSPHIAVFTNLYPEHLNHHESFEAYKQAKLNIARFQTTHDYFVNASNIDVSFEGTVVKPDLNDSFETHLLGSHNQRNCATAFEVAKIIGVSESKARDAIKTFKPLEHRMQSIGTYKGITFYDDTLATIPEAATQSIEALKDSIDTVILGGTDRGIDFSEFFFAPQYYFYSQFYYFP